MQSADITGMSAFAAAAWDVYVRYTRARRCRVASTVTSFVHKHRKRPWDRTGGINPSPCGCKQLFLLERHLSHGFDCRTLARSLA